MIPTGKRNDRPSQDEQNRLPRSEVGGRYLSTYSPELALQVIERIAEGETLTKICKGQPGMPHPTTFRRWMVNNPDLARAFEVALRVSAASMEEEALDMARQIADKPKDGTHVRAAEVKINQLRWSAERRDASKYGNRAQVSIKVPVQIVTPLNLNISDGESIPDIYNIEAVALKSPEAAAKIAESLGPLVPERTIAVGGRRKVVLTPPGGAKRLSPFSKIMRGEEYERSNVRKQGSEAVNRQEPSGTGQQTVRLGREAEDIQRQDTQEVGDAEGTREDE